MTLRLKSLLIIGGAIVILIAIIYTASRLIVLDGSLRLEAKNMRTNMAGVQDILDNDLANLSATVGDYAGWDDTYEFVIDRNQKYIQSNMVDEVFTGLNINYLLILNLQGKLVYAKGYDTVRQTVGSVPNDLCQNILEWIPTSRYDEPGFVAKGLVDLHHGLAMIAARPILTSNNKGPAHGLFVMIRMIKTTQILRWSQMASLSLDIWRRNNPRLVKALGGAYQAGDVMLVKPVNNERVAGYKYLKDLAGRDLFVLRIETDRDIFQQGRLINLYILLCLAVIGTAFIAIFLLLLEKLVLSRLTALSNDVSGVATSGDLSDRVSMSGRDELAGLAGSINGMLAALELSQEQLIYLSGHDSLTGLYSRGYFEQKMRQYSDGRIMDIGIILCDIDGLRLINDTLGHDTGDQLLIATAEVMRESALPDDIVARVGGDEFAFLIQNATVVTLEERCRQIRDEIGSYNTKHPTLPLSISMGLSSGTVPLKSLTDLYNDADTSVNREKLHRAKSTRSAIVQALMKAMEARDFITEGHADRLPKLAAMLAGTIGLSERRTSELSLLAQFHDIGKVGIPDRILFKNSSLTEEETFEMQKHSAIGYRIAQSLSDLMPIADWILKHHELWNGSGYPFHLKEEEIPLECRILAIIDAYDAMTSDRPYRKALSNRQAIKELGKYAGIRYEPVLVKQFMRIMEERFEAI